MTAYEKTMVARLLWILVAECYQISIEHGFHPEEIEDNPVNEQYVAGLKIALIHSELGEVMEAVRHNNPPSKHIPEFTSVEEEFADTIIRILDECGRKGWRIGEAILAKMEFNRKREFRHGKLS